MEQDSIEKVTKDLEVYNTSVHKTQISIVLGDLIARLRAIAARQETTTFEERRAIRVESHDVGYAKGLREAKSTPSPQASDLADRLGRWWQAWASETTWGGNKELMAILDELRTLSAPKPSEKAEEVAKRLEHWSRLTFATCGPTAERVALKFLIADVRALSPAPSPSAMPEAVVAGIVQDISDEVGNYDYTAMSTLRRLVSELKHALYSPPGAKDEGEVPASVATALTKHLAAVPSKRSVVLVSESNEGAITLSMHGEILFCVGLAQLASRLLLDRAGLKKLSIEDHIPHE